MLEKVIENSNRNKSKSKKKLKTNNHKLQHSVAQSDQFFQTILDQKDGIEIDGKKEKKSKKKNEEKINFQETNTSELWFASLHSS